MKKWQFYTIIALIIIWFWIVIYQNYRILDYNRVLDLRQAHIVKEIYSMEWDIQAIQDKLKPMDRMIESIYTELKRSN